MRLPEHDVLGTIRAWLARACPGTREKRSMRRVLGLARIDSMKTRVALISVALLLLSGGGSLDLAVAQEGTPE